MEEGLAKAALARPSAPTGLDGRPGAEAGQHRGADAADVDEPEGEGADPRHGADEGEGRVACEQAGPTGLVGVPCGQPVAHPAGACGQAGQADEYPLLFSLSCPCPLPGAIYW